MTDGAPSPTPTARARPDFYPEAGWDPDKKDFKPDYLKELIVRDAASESRRLSLPQKAEEYPVELPKDFSPPPGIKFEIDKNDPLYTKGQAWAHKHGLTKEAFIEGLGLVAAGKVGDAQFSETAKNTEIGKLGVNGTARIDAIATWLPAVVGDKGKAFATLLKAYPVANTVEMLEALMLKVQGTDTFSQQHRATQPTNGKIDGYEKMSFEQRRAAQDAQSAKQPAAR